ncbi:MAG TPA: cupredoxin domain-containing protein [Gemmatimonadaceae bacterium]|nr:cupredoxin domain-containing protein [Gemmatimonadaceae bacterium]
MNTIDWIVLAAGTAAIAWVNWYFFLAQRPAARAVASGGVQSIDVSVKGGYDPGVIRVKRGTPVRLVFDRQETSSCSEEVVIPAFSIRRFLPPYQKTAVELTPDRSGTFDISCGMSMLHAKLLVED